MIGKLDFVLRYFSRYCKFLEDFPALVQSGYFLCRLWTLDVLGTINLMIF